MRDVMEINGHTDERTAEILAAIQSGGSADATLVLFGLYADDKGLWDWAFRQKQIGQALNTGFNLNSAALAACESVGAIAANSSVIATIGANAEAVEICSKNTTLAAALVNYMDDESILAGGLGYQKYSVGDEVTLSWNGAKKVFTVVHKGYRTAGKIVLCAKEPMGVHKWDSLPHNKYSISEMRTHLNTEILGGFSDGIQAAIVEAEIPCHDYTTAVTCKDKIWALSYTEVGLALVMGGNAYAPAEGSALSWFNSNERRKKSGIWWLRTPYTGNTNNAWGVDGNGVSCSNSQTAEYGVVPAFEI